MEKMELPGKETVAAFGGPSEMERMTGRAKSTLFSRTKGRNRFPHWWTTDLQSIAEREGIALPPPKPRKSKKRKVA